jgi:hypothetical protein
MQIPGGWRAGGVRKRRGMEAGGACGAGGVGRRRIAAAVLVAAGLAVFTTGAASAGEPDDDGPDAVIVTCEDGELVVREPTEEEREWSRALPVPAERVRTLPDAAEGTEWHRVEPDGRVEGETRVLPEGGAVRVVPAEPGERPPGECDAHVPPRAERGERAVPALPR